MSEQPFPLRKSACGFDDGIAAILPGTEVDFFRGSASVTRHGICKCVVFNELGFGGKELIPVDEGVRRCKNENTARKKQQGRRSGDCFQHVGLTHEDLGLVRL